MLLLDAQGKVDETIETVETVTDITEDLGEDVEKVAEALENKIPDQEAKLKEAVETIDRLAKDVVKETEEAKRLIQKVEDAEKKVEKIVGIEEEREKR